MICGISSGFGSVFGTPLAGTVFGLEVLAIDLFAMKLFSLVLWQPLGDIVTSAWGIHHHLYHIGNIPELSWLLIVKL